MTTWIFRTLIIAAEDQAMTSTISETLGGTGGTNMWLTGLSADGTEPATHYIATGLIGEEFAAMVPTATWEQIDDVWTQTDYVPGNALLVSMACAQADVTVTQAEVEAIYARADVTAQEPFVAMARLGLMLVQPETV
jgi:hypothetical protein